MNLIARGDAMKKINLITDTGHFWSMLYVAKLFKFFLEVNYDANVTINNHYLKGYHNILIDETWTSLVNGRYAEVWWTDTPIPVVRMQGFYSKKVESNKDKVFNRNYAISNSNKELMEKYGVRVDGVIPRLFNDLMDLEVPKKPEKVYDVLVIGKWDSVDRKNIRLACEVIGKLKLKAAIVTDKLTIHIRRLSNVDYIPYGSLSDQAKAKLFAKSKYLLWLSFYEGFGMPVAEAMYLGVPVIYSDCPAHNEFAVGFPVKPSGTIITAGYGMWMEKKTLKLADVVDVVRKALEVTDEEYKELCEKAKDRAHRIYDEFLDKVELILPQ